jgi:hypothetical protein
MPQPRLPTDWTLVLDQLDRVIQEARQQSAAMEQDVRAKGKPARRIPSPEHTALCLRAFEQCLARAEADIDAVDRELMDGARVMRDWLERVKRLKEKLELGQAQDVS